MTYSIIKSQPFYPPGTASSIRRDSATSPNPKPLAFVPPSRVMRATEIPVNYLNEKLRFVVARTEENVHSYRDTDLTEGATAGGSSSSSSETHTHIDNYKTEIWLDTASYAANAQYEKSKNNMMKSEAEVKKYRRQEQLKAGERAKRANLLEDEHNRDEVREMATDIMATSATKLTLFHLIFVWLASLFRFARP